MTRTLSIITVAYLASLCGGCDDGAAGTVTATVYGEAFIEDGIPVASGEQPGFVDGWALQFDSFLVSIGNMQMKAGERGAEVGTVELFVVDLAESSGGTGYELVSFEAPAGTYDHYGYVVKPDPNATAVNADAAEVAQMKSRGYSIWAKGTATKGAVTKTFDWGFPLKLTHAHCELAEAIDGGTLEIQSTIHSDHLFFDDATSPDPEIAFQLFADADGKVGAADGVITLEELAATDIRSQTRYQVGSLRDPSGNSIINLKQYLEVQVTTVGHINGEGHCADLIVLP